MLSISLRKQNWLTILLPVLLGLVAMLYFSKISQAATSANVAATVTIQNVSVSVSDGSISYGTLAVNSSKSTLTGGLVDQQTASNSGNVAEDFTIRGTNSSGGWVLDSANSTLDHYIHKFCTATCGTDVAPTNFAALTTGYVALGSNVGAGSTQKFDLQITTPQTTSILTQQSVDVTILATAH